MDASVVYFIQGDKLKKFYKYFIFWCAYYAKQGIHKTLFYPILQAIGICNSNKLQSFVEASIKN